MRRLLMLACLLLATAAILSGCRPPGSTEPTVEYVGPPPHHPGEPDVKVAGDHFAYIVSRGGQEHLVLDGKEGAPFSAIYAVALAEGGGCAYVGHANGTDTPVIDGVAQQAWPRVWGPFCWSDGATHMAYVVRRECRHHVVLNRRPSPAYDWVTGLRVSDGGLVAYSARQGNRQFVVLDGKPRRFYDAVYDVAMARETGAICYVARRDGRTRVVRDDREQPPYDAVLEGSLVVTDDGRHWRYVAERAGRWHMVVNGHEGPGYDAVSSREVALSSDSLDFAYAAGRGGQWSIVTDGTEGPAYDSVSSATYGPDGTHFAYAAVREDGRGVVVLDGKEGPAYDGVLADTLALGPGGRLAYGIEREGRAVMVVDGAEGEPFDWVYKAALAAQGRYAYRAWDTGQWRVIVDGKASRLYDAVREKLAFREDGEHLYYVARDDGKQFVILDGKEGRHFRHVVPDSPRFTEKGTFEYLAFTDDGLYRLTHTLPKPAVGSAKQPPPPAKP
jgi:hypothetical protein